MECPACGGPTSVVETRRGPRENRRRRECDDCQHRFTTKELLYSDIKSTQKSLKQLATLLSTIKATWAEVALHQLAPIIGQFCANDRRQKTNF
jgi:hypothetical protein